MFEIGSSLRAAREHQKLGLADVERATRIRAKYLQALEDERWDVLPGTAYVKGFLRTYADFLGLDGLRFVEELNERLTPAEPFESPPLIHVQRRRLLDARLVVIPLAAAIGVLTLRLVSGGGGKHAAPPAPPPATVHVRATTTTHTTPVTPRLAHVVLVAVRGPCWIEVRSGSRRLYQKELVLGERALFTGKRLWIRLGAPWNVDATVNGKARQLPQVTGNIVVTAS